MSGGSAAGGWFLNTSRTGEQTAGRDLARVAAGEISPENYRRWMGAESVFIAEKRPWDRVAAIVGGTPTLGHDQADEIVVADPPRRPGGR